MSEALGVRAAALICATMAACESRPPEPEVERPSRAPAAAPETRRLELPGVAVEAPASFVDLEPDRVERLRQAAVRYDPTGVATVVGLRAPGTMLDGTVYVQSGHARRGISLNELTVRRALEGESEVMATPQKDDDIVSVSVGPVPGAKSVVTFLGKRGMNAPPLPGMPKLPGVP